MRGFVRALIRTEATRRVQPFSTGQPRPLPAVYKPAPERRAINRGYYPDAELGGCCFCERGFLGYRYGRNRFGFGLYMCSDCVWACFGPQVRKPPASVQLQLELTEKTGTTE